MPAEIDEPVVVDAKHLLGRLVVVQPRGRAEDAEDDLGLYAVHLHVSKAQVRVGRTANAFLAVLVETHCRHLVDTIILSRDELLTGRTDAADQSERRPVLASPVRAVGAVHHVGHALAHGGGRIRSEQIGRDPGHVDVAVGGDPCVVHGRDDTPAPRPLTCLSTSGNVPDHSTQSDPSLPSIRSTVKEDAMNRRDFMRVSAAGMSAAAVVGTRRRATAASKYPDWIPASAKPPKRGGVLARASAWDPPVIDPRLTQSIGLFQFVGLTSNRLIRYSFPEETNNTDDVTLRPDLDESWQSSSDSRVWTFKIRQGVKWHNVPPLNGRELTAADVKYCYEQYAKEGVQAFTFQEIEGMETPDKHTLRVHLKTANTLFPQNVAESVTVIFPREVLEEDGDLKKRLVGTGPYILKEHTRKVRIVLQRNPDYYDKGRPYIDEYIILSTPDAATRLAAFRTGQSDIIWLASPSEVETVRKTNANAQVQSHHNTLAPFGLALAQDRPPFNDVRVRRAISMAVDRQKQVDTVYEGHGIPGSGVPYIYYQDKAPTLK